IVDRLGDADDGQPFGRQFEADLLRTVAADNDQRVQSHGLGIVDDLAGEIAHRLLSVVGDAIGEGIAAVGGSQDGSTARQDSAYIVEQQWTAFLGPDEAVKAVANSDDLISILEDGGFHGSADDCVESRAVSTSRADTNGSNLRHDLNHRYLHGRWRLPGTQRSHPR